MAKLNYIDLEEYNYLTSDRKDIYFKGFHTNIIRCKLGGTKTFYVKEDKTIKITLRCSMHNCAFTGYYTYEVD